MSTDPRPRLRWLPIVLGLLIAGLLAVLQLTRTTETELEGKTFTPNETTPRG